MSSSYYREFVSGFNWWYVYAYVSLNVAGMYAFLNLTIRDGHIHLRWPKRHTTLMYGIMTCILVIMIVKESWTEICQLLCQLLYIGGIRGVESSVWVYALATIAVAYCGVIFAEALSVVDRSVNLCQEAFLKAQLRRTQSQQEPAPQPRRVVIRRLKQRQRHGTQQELAPQPRIVVRHQKKG